MENTYELSRRGSPSYIEKLKMDLELPHAENLRKHRRTTEPGTFFITKCLEPRKNILTESNVADVIIETFKFAVENNRIHLAAFVVMPNHWHVLFAVQPTWTLPKIMKTMSNWISRQAANVLKQYGVAWQDGYHDTRIRSRKQFQYAIDYIEDNPVKKGLVETKEQWHWSSVNSKYQEHLIRPWPWAFEKDVE